MRTNIPYEFTYDLRIAGKSVAEIDMRCVLIVGTRGDHAFITDVHDIEFKFTDWTDETKTKTEQGYVPATSAYDLILEAAVKHHLTDGAGHDTALASIDLPRLAVGA